MSIIEDYLRNKTKNIKQTKHISLQSILREAKEYNSKLTLHELAIYCLAVSKDCRFKGYKEVKNEIEKIITDLQNL